VRALATRRSACLVPPGSPLAPPRAATHTRARLLGLD